MSRLVIMKGLPASGKSTRAKELAIEKGNAIRLNRDLLRTMLHFDKWSGKNERITKKAERALVRELIQDKVVIIDDTNLHEGTLQSWKDLAKELGVNWEVVEMDTPIDVCIDRDRNRPNAVGKEVIINMARRNGQFLNDRPDVIVDIDGTLADTSERLHWLEGEKKNWGKFFEELVNDEPRMAIVDLVNTFRKDNNIVLVSGRPDTHKQQTIEWLNKHGIAYETLIMRQSDDKRPDTEIKKDIFDAYFKGRKIALVIDDRPSVIRMWKENGLSVQDVGKGIEF